MLFRIKSVIYYVKKNPALWGLVILAPVSCLWSESASVTLTESYVNIFAMSIFGLYFIVVNSHEQQRGLIALAFFIGIATSFISALAMPHIGVHLSGPHAGAWMGTYGHKNALGRYMTLGAIFFFSGLLQNAKLARNWSGFICCVLLILLSTSKTSLVVLLTTIIFTLVYKRYRWKGNWTAACASLSVLILGFLSQLLVNNWVLLLTSLGRDPTLTGRTDIWSFILIKLQEKLLWGYGYGTFWLQENTHIRELEILLHGYIPANSHNGLLEVGISLGLVGVFLFIGSYLTAYIRALREAYKASGYGLWNLSFLTLFLLFNLTESTLLGGWSLYWVIYIVTTNSPGRSAVNYLNSESLLRVKNSRTRNPYILG